MPDRKTKKLRKLFDSWLTSLRPTHAATTLATWENYVTAHFVPFFESRRGFTQERCGEYIKQRLTEVTAATVKKERTALRSARYVKPSFRAAQETLGERRAS